MIARKIEHTTYKGVLLFSASPKFGWTPLGGGVFGLLNSCSGVNWVKIEGMIVIRNNIHTSRSTDTVCEEFEVRCFFLLRSRRLERVSIEERES